MLTSVHLTYILGSLPFEERFRAARELGFNAVENPFPYACKPEDYAKLLKDNGLQQISIGAPASDYKNGEPGFSLTPVLKDKFDRSIDTVIGYAKTIGCRQVHVFAGAKAPDVSDALAFETYCTRVAEAHDRLAVEGLGVVIEPVNSTDFKGYFMDNLGLLVKVLQEVRRKDIKVILDVYHAHVNDEDPVEFLVNHGEKVAHIQLADYPGRHEPGTAGIDFSRLFRTLESIDYQGSIGLEYVPTSSIFDRVPLAVELGINRPKSLEPTAAK